MILADMGAEVIKIEEPKVGDESRGYTPFIKDVSAYFININRNKKGIALNLKHPKGREIFLELIKKSDVVVENYRPGTMKRLGLDYETLSKVNPRIIYASISGFGRYGPYKERAGYDLIGQAMGGIMSITGWPETPPTRVGTAIGDILAALFCCIGILAALKARDLTGIGQSIDVALVDSVMAACEAYNEMYLVEGKIPTRIGNRYEFIYPYDTFKTRDGWVAIGIGNDKMWRCFCKIMEREDLAEDPRYETNRKRVENHILLKQIIEEWTSTKTTNEVLDLLLEHKIPCGPVYTIDKVCNDPHIARAREMVVEIEHPTVGKIKIVGCPIKMSLTPPKVRSSAPALGEHTEEVLSELLGLTREQLEQLRREGVIG
jgi:formyl-CoA transferase